MIKTIFRGIAPGIMVERICRENTFVMPALHFHNEYEIYYLYGGHRQYIINNKYYDLAKGSLALINKQEIHRTLSTPNPAHDRLLIEFYETPFADFLSSTFDISLSDFFISNCGVVHLDKAGQSYVEHLFASMQREFHASAFAYEKVIMLRLSELILYIHRLNHKNYIHLDKPSSTYKQNEKYLLVQNIHAYIKSPQGRFTSLEDLSARFFLSKTYLSRIYKQFTGLTVHESINIHRIKFAQDLLVNTNESVEKVALSSGFQSLTYFERIFRKHTNTSPLKYRKRIRRIIQSARIHADNNY
ncbi:MAG: AraC family transcriptional regulator [Lachnospiraceae bacterium]